MQRGREYRWNFFQHPVGNSWICGCDIGVDRVEVFAVCLSGATESGGGALRLDEKEAVLAELELARSAAAAGSQ